MPQHAQEVPGPDAALAVAPAEVAGALTRLPAFDTAALRVEWERLHRRPPLPDLTRDLLLRGIAHRLQEQAFGALSPAMARRLESAAAPGRAGPTPRARASRLKPGTVLVRGWRGQTHTVTVRDDGLDYQGRLYRSLSLVAREITGAHWSGVHASSGSPATRPRRADPG
ncbi:MAG TPA: DUF2924 domain-containing protein [Falsiroseomonas sp.]|jgi:hypothetical protein|nr:DUF2924 domain-containing protein [Falsiroseomonas sp.]